ncbi:hypothetical protein [Nocardia sp. alder85J]|uniref:hypothetical protein n=1 Tax=Nocardia sp. alder85J TaxID=2862949 RepID=UPI0022540DA5|nr:hypothetical protein [Nocardia sp. alder85J]MCX4099044.1 hypothetical protein [Nocardia sp. alder85J]
MSAATVIAGCAGRVCGTRADWRALPAGMCREPFEVQPPPEAVDLAVWRYVTARLRQRRRDHRLTGKPLPLRE